MLSPSGLRNDKEDTDDKPTIWKDNGRSGKKNILDDSRIRTVKTESLSCLLYEHKWKLQRKISVWVSAIDLGSNPSSITSTLFSLS